MKKQFAMRYDALLNGIDNKLTEDGEHIILTLDEVNTMNTLSDAVEEALEDLRECGISIKIN